MQIRNCRIQNVKLRKFYGLKIILTFAICILQFALLTPNLWAFGKNNKIIRNVPNWFVAESEHFQIYYYPEEANLIPKVSQYLERAYQKVCADLNHFIPTKLPIVLFISHNEFNGNNIADVDEYTGGFTEAFKYRLVLPNHGSDKWFNHVITHEFTHEVEFDILYSGFWKSARLIKSIFYPLWLMEGLAEYEAGEIDSTTREMYLRDAALSGKLIPLRKLLNFAHLKPHQVVLAYKEGESVMHFIANEYGREKVGLMLKAFRERFDSQSVISDVLGGDFNLFDKKWQEYLETSYRRKQRQLPLLEPTIYGKQITVNHTDFYDFNTNAVYSPDGKYLAYLTDHRGVNEIVLLDRSDNEIETLVGRNSYYKIDFIHSDGHALAWSPKGNVIAFAAKKSEKDYLFLYNLRTKHLQQLSFPLERVYSPCFSPDGEKIVFVGMKGGGNDLYLTDLQGQFKALTNDHNNNNYPVFSPDGQKIVYSSEREEWNNLYILQLTDLSITPLTSLPRDELSPVWTPDGRWVVFVNDQDEVYNLYAIGSDGSQLQRLTQVIGATFTPQVSPDGKELLFSSFRNGETQIYAGPLNFPYEETYQTSLNTPAVTKLPSVRLKPAYSYKFYASTDLFFPVFAYSSTEGAFIFTYWQASEMMGNHSLGLQLLYGSELDSDSLDYQIIYTYKRWRPQLTFGSQGNTSSFTQTDTNQRIRRKEFDQGLILAYPFDRFNRVEFGAATSAVESRNRTLGDVTEKTRDNLGSIALVRDTSYGKYIELDSGSRTDLIWEKSVKGFKGGFDYQNYILNTENFFPIFRQSIVAYRLLAAFNRGTDEKTFTLPVRGFASEENKGRNILLANFDLKFPLFTNLDYHMWYFVPDFYFKSLYGFVFTDLGLNWQDRQEYRQLKTNEIKNSIGVGSRLHTFILQSFLLTFSFEWAKPTNRSSPGIFYVKIGTIF